MKVPGHGPIPAKILILGEAPGKDEEENGKPFIGKSGLELTRMLHEAGIPRSECYVTNVCKYRPPENKIDNWIDKRKTCPPGFVRASALDRWVHPHVAEGLLELASEVQAINPNLIVAFGNTPLLALTGNTGITKWRGSLIESNPLGGSRWKMLPTYHPAAILRQWSWRAITVHDLRRAKREADTRAMPERVERFIIRPSYQAAVQCLKDLIQRANEAPEAIRISPDVETRHGQVTCFGVAWSKHDAICIPFFSRAGIGGCYWTLEEETELVLLIKRLVTHPKVLVCWQNGVYDIQYHAKLWGFLPNHQADTMTLQHVMWSGMPKSLDFICSMYQDNYVFWKEEGRNWDPAKDPEEDYWIYNCRDTAGTYECGWDVMPQVYEQLKFKSTKYGSPLEIQHRMQRHMLHCMLRGVRFDFQAGAHMLFDLGEARGVREQWINAIAGRPLNTNSPPQLQALFYGELGLRPILNRKTKRPTTDADALDKIAERDPMLRPICNLINQVRQIRSSQSVILQPKDTDGRIRCSFNISGTETYRFSSSEDAFGFGTNLQNVSPGDEPDSKYPGYKPTLPLPNLRKLFLPDVNHTWGDFDLPQADARVVAWEAGDEELMAIFNDPKVDLHNENAKAIFGAKQFIEKDGKLIHPDRQIARQGVHAVNYLVQPMMLAALLGITVHEADNFIQRWLGAHPKISAWHAKVIHDLQTRRYVENIYGYRRYYFDRIEGIVKEAVAWIPQSTTAITINLGIDAVCQDGALRAAGVELLLQVHDSADFQWPTRRDAELRPRVLERMTIEVPYEKPLIMPPGVKTSTVSWGHCK